MREVNRGEQVRGDRMGTKALERMREEHTNAQYKPEPARRLSTR